MCLRLLLLVSLGLAACVAFDAPPVPVPLLGNGSEEGSAGAGNATDDGMPHVLNSTAVPQDGLGNDTDAPSDVVQRSTSAPADAAHVNGTDAPMNDTAAGNATDVPDVHWNATDVPAEANDTTTHIPTPAPPTPHSPAPDMQGNTTSVPAVVQGNATDAPSDHVQNYTSAPAAVRANATDAPAAHHHTAAPDTHRNTSAPSPPTTPRPATASPTSMPPTPAPPTPTPAPPTEVPPTNVPPTSEPRTPSPPRTPAPPTEAPPTPEPLPPQPCPFGEPQEGCLLYFDHADTQRFETLEGAYQACCDNRQGCLGVVEKRGCNHTREYFLGRGPLNETVNHTHMYTTFVLLPVYDGLSPVVIALLVTGVLTTVYCAMGMSIKVQQGETSCPEVLPNGEFWAGLPTAVGACCMHICQFIGSSNPYSSIPMDVDEMDMVPTPPPAASLHPSSL